ncbi:MAG TPA: DUF2341 domain-containing protein [Chitinispirillaceae bacterium]|nr:DUF2341 domain-containing protein [Chitinispirillaceae bacterium]
MKHLLIFATLTWALLLFCSPSPVDMAGGSTSTPNEIVMGYAVLPSGAPASRTIVQMIPSAYVAFDNVSQSTFLTDTTDTSGAYCFFHVDTGMYNIQAVKIDNGSRALVTSIAVDTDTIRAPSATVVPPGKLYVVFSDEFNPVSGYCFIPGTTIAALIDHKRDTLVLDSIPAGIISGVYFAATESSEQTVLRYTIPVSSGENVTLLNPVWKFSRRLYLNTTTTGAAVDSTITDFPVLIRMSNENFNFRQVQGSGADIRFSKSDNTPLAYEIERWDSTNGKAEIWVKVDTVYGNDSTQYVQMYWGNPDAHENSNSTIVFDTATGFQGVWHMGQQGNTSAFDATANHFDGTPSGMNAAALVEGIIGRSQRFDGTASYISLTGTAGSTLNFPQNGNYTFSAWVYTEVLDGKAHYILSKSNNSYNLDLSSKNLWEMYDVEDGAGLQSVYAQPTSQQWKYLAGVCKGKDMRLYVDGICIDSTIDVVSGVPHESGTDVHIGKRADSDYGYWNGMLDEVCLMSVSLSPDWIKLCYMNQRMDNKLVIIK